MANRVEGEILKKEEKKTEITRCYKETYKEKSNDVN